MLLPEDTEHRRFILRRLLAGSPLVYPVMVWANCGGDPSEFDLARQLALGEDLRALGYERHLRDRIPTSGHFMFVWMREEWPADVFGPMPYFGPSVEQET